MRAPAPAILAILLCILGCGQHRDEERETGHSLDSMATVPGDSSSLSDAPLETGLPAGPPIGHDDPLVNSARPILADWARLWAAALPGFTVDSLWRVGRTKWRPLDLRKFETPGGTERDPGDVTFEVLGIVSPDERRTLFVDSYQYIRPEADSVDFGGDPDSRSSLIDHRAKTDATLQQCGTPCRFDWGGWLSPAVFALGGWYEAGAAGEWKQGRLWIYSIPDSTVVEYTTRVIGNEPFEKYQREWGRWLTRRYRAWRRSHPST